MRRPRAKQRIAHMLTPKTSSSQGSTGKGLKLGFAVLFALGGIGAAVYGGFFYGEQSVDTQAMVLCRCSKCGTEFEMPFAEYIALAPQGSDLAGGITCSKCGAESAAVRVNRESDRVVTPPDYDKWRKEALTVDDLRKEKGLENDEGEYVLPKKKPAKFVPN